jgi:hypothetical protein
MASPAGRARHPSPQVPLRRRLPRRQQWRHTWRRVRWSAVASLWLLGLALGYIGFSKHAAATAVALSPLDRFYLTLQLIPMNSGAVPPPVSWELEVARLLIPLVAAYTVVQALALLFVDQVQAFRLRFLHDHTVICGLGRKGSLLARSFLAQGEQVIVIERDGDDNLIQPSRDEGAIVLVGDATDPETLRRAGVHHAKYVIAVSGDDGANAEVAVRVQALCADRAEDPLTCLVHLVDPQLCNLLRERELKSGEPDGFRLEFFNTYDLGARAMLDEWPPFDAGKQVDQETSRQGRGKFDGASASAEDGTSPPHVLLVGLGSMGRGLVVRAARLWRERQDRAGKRLRITVVDRDADRKVETLHLYYPKLEKVCELIPRQIDVAWPEFERADFMNEEDGCCRLSAIYICFDNDSLGLAAALTLLQRVRGQGIPIVVRMASSTGLAALLGQPGLADDAFADLHVFPLLDRTCQPDLLLGGTHETLARAIHEEYMRQQLAAGETPATNPTILSWDELPEPIRESNRRQADHIGAKLRVAGCRLAPLTDWDAEAFEFPADRVEQLARGEHERFVVERLATGWAFAPGPKDLARKLSPDLVPWEELSEATREKDRASVRGLPRFLARAGLQVHRAR